MYVIDGKLTVRTNPELLVGQYGYFVPRGEPNASGELPFYSYALEKGGEAAEARVRAQLSRKQELGRIGLDVEVERLETPEQAERYAIPYDVRIDIARVRRPDVITVASREVPDTAQLLAAKLFLFRETRTPIPFLWYKGIGDLIAQVDFTLDRGWRVSEDVTGHRTSTPRGRMYDVQQHSL